MVIKCKCINRVKDNKGINKAYVLQASDGSTKEFTSEQVKNYMRTKQIEVTNLTLTSDNRLVVKQNAKSQDTALVITKDMLELVGEFDKYNTEKIYSQQCIDILNMITTNKYKANEQHKGNNAILYKLLDIDMKIKGTVGSTMNAFILTNPVHPLIAIDYTGCAWGGPVLLYSIDTKLEKVRCALINPHSVSNIPNFNGEVTKEEHIAYQSTKTHKEKIKTGRVLYWTWYKSAGSFCGSDKMLLTLNIDTLESKITKLERGDDKAMTFSMT